MAELSTLAKSRFLVNSQARTNQVEMDQLSAVDTLTKALKILADQSLSEGEKMALVSKIAGYVQLATLFLGPLFVVGGVLAAGGTVATLVTETTITGATQLTQGALVATQGVLEGASASAKSTIQKDKTSTTALQKDIDSILDSIKDQNDKAQWQAASAVKILGNDARIGSQEII